MRHQRRARSWVALLAICASAVAVLVALPSTVAPTQSAQAVTAADWRPGNIIDDATFYNSNSMNAADVQAFMERQLRTCNAGYTCLKDYRQNTENRSADKYCDGYTGRANESAATILDRVARSCGVSQQVLLVLLQKEQGLLTDSAPSATKYAKAMGQGCPDTAGCNQATAGYFFQVYYAARQYEIYRLNPTSFAYQAGRWNSILLHPYNTSCGSQSVYIENQATAGLYIYTPYVPNTSALNNMYGTGDGCASYGNRNFWRLFSDWFGSTRVPANPNGPFGAVDAVTPVVGGYQVSGWAADPNAADSISIHVYVSGVGYPFVADQTRADVAAAYPALGAAHGYSVFVPATTAGMNDVCIYGINIGAGWNSELKCSRVSAMAGPPIGVFEGTNAVAGGIWAGGWAIDPDTANPIDVHLYVDGVGTATRADQTRTDVGAVYPKYGSAHGFGRVIPAAPGDHTVCAYAINIAIGANVELGCKTVKVPVVVDNGRAPIGNLEAVVVNDGTVAAVGWAIDPDTAAPIQLRVESGDVRVTRAADIRRDDVGASYPSSGANHGFNVPMNLIGGTRQVCVTAINNGTGGDTILGCRTVTIPVPDRGRAPIGVVDAVSVNGMSATVSGWALDQDTVSPVSIHIYVGSRSAAYSAGKTRADIGAAFPLQGPDHGFSESVAVPAGASDVCVYAINNGAGGNSLLGCRAIQVADHTRPPVGNLENLGTAAGAITVVGWTFDPDTTGPIPVHVYVDGVGRAYQADADRSDVAAAYPAAGSRHGFNLSIAAAPGAHNVCVYSINDVPGPNTLLGCSSVTVR